MAEARRYPATEVAPGKFWPELYITVEAGGGSYKIPALVDSGADISVVPAEALLPLGIRYEDLPDDGEGSQGAGGGFDTRTCPGRLAWRNWELRDFDVAEPGSLRIRTLLGRDDFFRMYQVTFDWTCEEPWFEVLEA